MEEKLLKFKEILRDEEVANKLTSTEDMNEMVRILAENGLVVTVDELGQIAKEIADTNKDGEISEEDLEDVTGGGWIRVVIRVGIFIYKVWRHYH